MAKKNLSFKGFKEAEKILDALPGRLGPKVVQGIMREGAKPLIEQAQINAPEGPTGNLSRSIGAVNAKGAQKGSGIYVGPRRGTGKNAQGWHAHLIEFGTAPHRIKPDKKSVLAFNGRFAEHVNHPGNAAHPFLRPAWDQTNAAVLQKIGEGFKEVLLSNFKNVKY